MSGISPDAVTSSSLMSTQNRELFFVVNHDGTDTLVRATVKNIEEKDGRWTFVMEGRLPDGSPFTSTFSERAESDAEGFTYVEGVKILDQGAARAFALQNKMAIAESETNDSSDQRKLLNPEIEERLSRLRDRSERVVASLPEIPPGHTRVFRGITGEYKPKQPLSPAEQQELSKLRTLLGEGKLSPEQGNRFGELHTRNTPEMCGDDLLLVLRAYADAPDATLMYADIDLKQRPDIDIEHRGASGNFYIPPPGSMEWKMIPRTVLNAEGTAEQKSDAPLSKTVQLTPQEIGLIRVEKGWDSTNTGFRYEYTVDGYKFSINYPNWVSGFATEEHIIVNAMIAHNKGALELGIDPYRTLRAEEWEGDSLMINGGDLFNLKKFQSHLQEQRSQGFSDQDLAHYYAGHMIHETLHEPGTATKDNLLHGQHPIGEYTTITGQFAYYLSQGYFGDYSYEAPLYDSGTRIIQKAKDYGPFDYDPATSVAADLINNRLVETFPEESKGLETLDAITRCKEIGKRIPKERHGEFVAALQKAIGDSANKQMVAQATVDSAHRSTQLLSSGKLLAQNVREATVTGEANTQEKIVKDMKEFMKSNYVYSNARIQMAEALLGRTLEKNERNSILKAHNLPGVIDQLSPEELSAKTKELSKGITDPVERRLLIEAGICGEPSIDSKRASEDITKNLEGEQYEYAFRKIQRLQQAGRPESEVLPLAEEVIRAALLKGSRNQEDSYPSLEFSKKKEYVQVDSQGMKTDRRHFYKYDLIKSLNLPPAEHDRIISSVLDEMLADLEKQIPSRGYDSYSGTLRVDDALLLRIGEIQYHIPITSPDVLAKFQAKVRALAPSILIRGDIYPLQEIGNAFGVRWHTERHQYAKQACVQLLTQASTMTERDIGLARIPKALVTLQEEYEVPLPDTDRQGVLKIFAACVGNSGDVPDRFVKAFSLTPAETKAAAIATCTGALEYSLSQPPSSYPENQAYEGNHLYVHALAKKYGISPSELGPLAPEVQKLHEAIVSDKGIDSFTKDLQKSQLKNYLPDFIQAETESALRSKDRSHLQKLQNACAISPELSKLYTQSINTIFSTDQSNDQLLDLNVEHNRALWLVLISKNETRKRAGQECDNFLASKGLDPHKMRLAWKQSSNNRTEKMPGSEKTYKEFMGTDLVYARNIARVAQLEQAQPGITKHLSDRWGIHMFTRYPNNILLRQYRQDKEPADNTKKKQTVLVLFPQSDWNGAFEREDLIKDIAKQSPESTHNLCIAESGQRYGCVRRVARAAQDFGPIDRLVLGGHSDGNTIHFGPNPDDSFSKENLQVNKENKEEYERQKTVIDRVRSYMAPDGKITLKACSTGKEGGIAQQITQTFEIDVHGPLVPSGIANIDIKTGTATHVADGKYSPTKQYVKPTWFEKMKTQLSKFWPFGKKTETKKEDDGTWHPHDSKEEP
ncbi:MAG TPA: hypothetical protein VJK52_01195, partial [Candidatus Nanoarchaeia archaeon]|nr:hypothetical protein [Candidatus Nanoarchaeia archaeon]